MSIEQRARQQARRQRRSAAGPGGVAPGPGDGRARGRPAGTHGPSLGSVPPVRTVDDLKPGQLLGRYQLLKQLGRGALGLVFLAEDTMVKQRVCIKVLHPKMAADPDAIARFHREIVLSRRVVHPSVCRVHELHEIDGLRFLTMEFVAGVPLQELTKAPMPPARAIAIAVRVCDALAAAHEVGVVHRDLKPRNIMVRENDDVVLLDFGIATALDLASGLTLPGLTLGTPNYIAPEVWEGKGATAKSDQFAVGVILFNMLTGTMPWSAPQDVMLYEAMLKAPAPAPSALRPMVGAALDLVVGKALALKPQDRFADITALRRGLAPVELLAKTASAQPARPRTLPAPLSMFAEATERIDLALEKTKGSAKRATSNEDDDRTLPLPSLAPLASSPGAPPVLVPPRLVPPDGQQSPTPPPKDTGGEIEEESASWVIGGQAVGPHLKTRPQQETKVFDDGDTKHGSQAPAKKSRGPLVAGVLVFGVVAGVLIAYLGGFLP